MEFLFLLGGVVLGSVFTHIIYHYKTGYGNFRLDPIDDPEVPDLYTVSIGLKQNQQLLNKKRIILIRDHSPK